VTYPLRKIGEIEQEGAVCIQTGPFGTQLKASDYTPEGVPVINVRNIGYSDLRPEKLEFVPEATADRLSVHILAEQDIVFGRKGAVDRHLFVASGYSGWIQGSDCIRLRLDREKINPRFVSYAFLSSRHKEWMLQQCGSKATMASLNQEIIRRIDLRVPKPAQQDEIVSILSAYDDLIENNRRRIALLERAARLLYREWFVYFRFPGHEHVKIIDGIPEGWERRTLGEVADSRLGKMLDEKKNRGELRPYLANVNVRWGRFEFDNLREMRFEPREVEKYGLMPGDIVMCEGGEPGRCAIWKDQVPGMMLQKALHRIRVHEGLDHRFLYHCLSFMAKSGRLAGLFTGATIKHLPREKLITVAVVVPPERLVREFADHVAPMEAQIGILEAANRRAAEARDLLLPRLMSGEIAV
jgi:type I restriction enzyme S subunit